MFAGIEKVEKRRNDTRITMPDRARLYPYPEVNTRHTKPAKGGQTIRNCVCKSGVYQMEEEKGMIRIKSGVRNRRGEL